MFDQESNHLSLPPNAELVKARSQMKEAFSLLRQEFKRSTSMETLLGRSPWFFVLGAFLIGFSVGREHRLIK